MRYEINAEALNKLPPDKQDRIKEVIEGLEWQAENNPLAFYFPHEKQQVFHRFRGKVRCFFGGNQSGKTTCGLADDLIQAIDWEVCPDHLKPYKQYDPPFLCRIMAPSFPVLETTLYQKLQELLPKQQLVGESWSKAFDKNLRVLHFKNGSKFFFQTYEMDVAKMGGATLNRVHYDEEPPQAARNESRIRVMRLGGEEIFTMTPVEGLTWTYDSFWQRRGEPLAEEGLASDIYVTKGEAEELIQMVTVDMDDNPTLTEQDKASALAGLSKEERKARKEGKFVALHGLIYGDYVDSFDGHVIPSTAKLPDHINVVVGIDPGIRNKAAVVWAYVRPDDTMVVFEEGYFDGLTVREVATQIHKTNAYYEVKPLYYVIDPAARNTEHQTGRSDQMEYADHGIVTIAGQNAVPAGINRIKERFQTQRLLIGENCRNLRNELKKYRWKQPPRTGEDGKQVPVKKDDHLLDALRYVVMSRPYLPLVPTENSESELQKMMREDQESAGKERPTGSFGGGMYV